MIVSFDPCNPIDDVLGDVENLSEDVVSLLDGFDYVIDFPTLLDIL